MSEVNALVPVWTHFQVGSVVWTTEPDLRGANICACGGGTS
jgi:hypothetical protein